METYLNGVFMSNVVVLEKEIMSLEERFNALLPSAVSEERFKQEALFSLQHLKRNDFLMSVARSNPQSLKDAVLNVATLEVSLNPANKHAYLVPRKINKQQAVILDISYMGMAHILVKSGAVEYIQAQIVKEKDKFMVNGVGKAPVHEFSPFGDRGNIIGAYAVAKLANGDVLTETMPINEIFSIRNRSESFKKGFGPWISDEGEMIKKTVIKRQAKMLPAHTEKVNKVIDYLNTDAGEGINFEEERKEEEQEKKQAMIEQRDRETEKLKEKEEILEEIKKFSRIYTEKSNMEEKITYMKEVLNVGSFKELEKLPIEYLSPKLKKVADLVRERNKNVKPSFVLESAK